MDRFATWRGELEKKVGAGQDVASELLEGAELVRAAEPHARGEDHARLARVRRRARPTPRAIRRHGSAAALSAGAPGAHGRVRRALGSHPCAPASTRCGWTGARAGFAAWYEFFPRSATPDPRRHGTFADAERALPRIAELGFDVVYLPPIHPIGRAHRKGPNNSLVGRAGRPRQPLGHRQRGRRPHRGEPRARARSRTSAASSAPPATLGLEVALDYALQCSPDHPWVREHPEWFFIRPDGTHQVRREPAQEVRGHLPDQLLVRRPRGALGRLPGRAPVLGRRTASAPSGWTTRTPSRSPSGSG